MWCGQKCRLLPAKGRLMMGTKKTGYILQQKYRFCCLFYRKRKLKNKIFLTTVTIFLLINMIPISGSQKESTWKGKIEYENGIKVVNNPDNPYFGELSLNLEEDLLIGNEEDQNYMFYQARDIKVDSHGNIFVLDAGNHRVQKFDKNGSYLQTIGREGQGPGEFADTYEMFIDDKNNLYVSGMRMIYVFNDKGEFVRNVALPIAQINFAVNTDGDFILSGFVASEKGQNYGVMISDRDGKILKNICEFPGINIFQRGKSMLFLSHEYSPILYFCPVSEKGVIYGCSPEYKLFFLNQSGTVSLIIKKDESFHSISKKEKEKIVDKIIARGNRAPRDMIEEAANFPNHRPFFNGIMADDKGRIFVKKAKSVLDESKEIEFDVFSNDGYYLYKINLTFTPKNIKNGNIYSVFTSEETSEVRIKRFKIKNWNQIKERIQK